MKRLVMVAALCLVPAIAHADAFSDADSRFKEGVALLKQGNVDLAREKWLQSLALDRSAAVLVNLAVLEAEAKHPEKALGYLREWLRHPKADPAKRASIEKNMLPVLEAETARVQVNAPPGQEVSVDGASKGNAPIRSAIDVLPGKHVVSCGARTVEITLQPGQSLTVDVGGGSGGPNPPPGEVGERESWFLPGTLAGLGVIGVGVGVGLGVASSANRSDATAAGVGKTCVDPNAPGCADVRSATNASNGTGTGAIVAYVVGGALLGGALVSMLILKPWKEKSRSVSVMPSLGGVVAIGTF